MNQKLKVYLSGPITKIGNSAAYQLFDTAESRWKNKGRYDIFNPMKYCEETDKAWDWYMRKDICKLMECDGIIMLADWRESKGAMLEYRIAKDLGMFILDDTTGYHMTDERITSEAERLVLGDRGKAYGHPSEDFARISQMWSAIKPGVEFTQRDVPKFMMCVKLSRDANKAKRDNLVDIAGYALTAQMCDEF